MAEETSTWDPTWIMTSVLEGRTVVCHSVFQRDCSPDPARRSPIDEGDDEEVHVVETMDIERPLQSGPIALPPKVRTSS